MTTTTTLSGLTIRGPIPPQYAEILTPEACAFLAGLFRAFEPRRLEILRSRAARQAELDAGVLPDFLPSTKPIRDGSWKVAPAPADLLDRRTEITGPVDRKMVINALNSGAKVFMADFEDATSPAWENLIEGHINLRDAVRRSISFTSPEGKVYSLNEKTATLLVRPRGWHLHEKHVLAGGAPVSASLFDFGLYLLPRAPRARIGPLFLPSENGGPSRGPAVERRVRLRPGGARNPAGLHPRDLADRGHPRRVRGRRDPLRAARARLGAQLRTLGLHLQLHQEAPCAQGLRVPGPGPGHDDGALHAGLLPACHQGVPPPRRARHGRNGRPDPDQEQPGRERGGARKGPCGQGAGGEGRARRHLGRASGPCACCASGVRQAHAGPQPGRPPAGRRERDRGRPACGPGRHDHRCGDPHEPERRDPVPRGVARGAGLRAALQPYGGCGDGGDLPGAALAMDPRRGEDRGRQADYPVVLRHAP